MFGRKYLQVFSRLLVGITCPFWEKSSGADPGLTYDKGTMMLIAPDYLSLPHESRQ
jgi:hypothetical protein